MPSNRFVFAVLAAACISAAAAGGYFASLQHATTAAPAVAVAPASAPASAAAPARAVQETEALVGEPSAKAQTPQAQMTAEAPAKRAEASARSLPSTSRASKAAEASRARQDAPATLERTWPASAATPPAPAVQAASADAATPPAARPDDRATLEPPRAPDPPAKTFEELVVAPDSVIGLQTERTISSETARVEDRVDARVTRDVRAGDRVAVAAGSRAIGSVTQVEKGGKFKERAHLAVRFHTLVLADGTRVPISTETVIRDGEAPSGAQKIGGGAVGGAILGAILGGAKGAVIGGATGAGAGAAAAGAGDRSAATLRAGDPITVRILSPVTVTIER